MYKYEEIILERVGFISFFHIVHIPLLCVFCTIDGLLPTRW